MEYSAGNVSNRFWFVETKETARLLQNNSMEEVKQIVIDQNLYQQKQESRLKKEFGCIRRRLESLPADLQKMLVTADLKTAKLIVLISIMATDRLFFELLYEIYRDKLYMGGSNITDADLNIFFKDKQDQSETVAGMSDSSIKKLKQVYTKYMLEVGLLSGKVTERKVEKVYMDPDLKYALQRNAMDNYVAAITGER